MSRVNHTRSSSIGALVLLLAFLGACGGEDVVQGMPGQTGGQAARPASTPSAVAATPSSTAQATELGRGITQLTFEGDIRDPFMRYFPAEAEVVDINAPVRPIEAEQQDMGPLANYTLDQLELVGIISRTAEPQAMFRIPVSGQNVFARIDDRIGPNGTGRISDIQPNRVVVTYETILLTGEQAQTVEVLLRDPRQQLEAQFDPF